MELRELGTKGWGQRLKDTPEKVKATVFDFAGRLCLPQAGSPVPLLCGPHSLGYLLAPRGNHSRCPGRQPFSRQLQRN